MMKTLAQVIKICNELWPEDTAAEWDQVGLVVGDKSSEIKKIVLAVDADSKIIENAVASGQDLIITHHPLLMRGKTAGGIKVGGNPQKNIETVALCGGAGDSLLYNPRVLAADVYITSDLRHHPAQEFLENSCVTGGPALIDVAHWAAESLWLETAAAQLRAKLPELSITVDNTRTDAWDFSVASTVLESEK